MSKEGPGIEPRHIDTLDEAALELPNGQAVPLPSPPQAARSVQQRDRSTAMRGALARYRLGLAALKLRGGDDGPIEPISSISPVHGSRAVDEIRFDP